MARIRTIKPELFTDAELASCTPWARWLFVGLLTEVDDKGRIIDSPKRICGAVFPHEDKVSAAKVKAWLDELVKIGCVKRYAVNGQPLLWLPNFLKHQRISHPTDSKLPPHPEELPKGSHDPPENPPNDSGSEVEVEVEVESEFEVESEVEQISSSSVLSSGENGQNEIDNHKTLEKRAFRWTDRAIEDFKLPTSACPKLMATFRLICPHLDDRIIDEAFGYCAKLADPPHTAKFLEVTIGEWAEQRAVTIPGIEQRRAS